MCIKTKKMRQLLKESEEARLLKVFMNVLGEDLPANRKMSRLNNVIMEEFKIKYSTIVVFNGSEYLIRATNVNSKHWEVLKSLHNEDVFKQSINTKEKKYFTVDKEEDTLPYQTMGFEVAKSALFLPLFNDNIYMGYWFIESQELHAFEDMNDEILQIISNNILAIAKMITYQDIVENISRTDQFTKLRSIEYLYGEGKEEIDKFTESIVCMFEITNVPEVNKEQGREVRKQINYRCC